MAWQMDGTSAVRGGRARFSGLAGSLSNPPNARRVRALARAIASAPGPFLGEGDRRGALIRPSRPPARAVRELDERIARLTSPRASGHTEVGHVHGMATSTRRTKTAQAPEFLRRDHDGVVASTPLHDGAVLAPVHRGLGRHPAVYEFQRKNDRDGVSKSSETKKKPPARVETTKLAPGRVALRAPNPDPILNVFFRTGTHRNRFRTAKPKFRAGKNKKRNPSPPKVDPVSTSPPSDSETESVAPAPEPKKSRRISIQDYQRMLRDPFSLNC